MAAWLAYLKSRLLIPEQKDEDEPTGEELAAALAFRLQRLEAMRKAAEALMQRNRLGRDVFARGAPQALSVQRKSVWSATIYDLLTAYAAQRQRQSVTSVRVRLRTVWSLQEARDLLSRLVGRMADWAPINSYLVDYLVDESERATVLASTFSASLEMVREGQLELRQSDPFAPIYLRRRQEARDGG
jgi:segregation and condensation protein A